MHTQATAGTAVRYYSTEIFPGGKTKNAGVNTKTRIPIEYTQGFLHGNALPQEK